MVNWSIWKAVCLIPMTLALEILLEVVVFAWLRLFPRRGPARPVPGTDTDTQSPIYRHFTCSNGVLHPPDNAPQNLLDAFKAAVQRNPNGRCLGTRVRDASGEITESYAWETYDRCFERMQQFHAGLEYLSVMPPNEAGMRLLGLFSKNRAESIIAEYAAYMQRGTTVPLYETFDQETVKYILNHTELATVVCSDALIEHLIDLKPHCPHLRCVIRMDNEPNASLTEQCKRNKLEVYTFNEIEELGRQNPREMLIPQPSDIATFCYTSGTTGLPKAAMLSHANFAAVIAGVDREGLHIYATDRYLSYLPLAHTFERLVCSYCLASGAAVGFYQGDVKKIVDDLKALRPTVFVSVPRLFNRVYDGILAKVNKNVLTKLLVNIALAHKIFAMETIGTTSHWIWDPLVFHKIAEGAGLDQCRLMASGSAPIAPHILSFVRAAFSCPVMEGYGCTESTALITVSAPTDFIPQQVGGPAPHAEVTLKAVEDMGYLPTDRMHRGEQCFGRGEICFRGTGMFQGYYKMEEKTESSIDQDGWFHTGDIAVWLSGGRLRVVDRQKHLFKLAQGEYIVPDKVEHVYSESEFVSQVFLYGDSMQSACVAIVIPEQNTFKELAVKTLGTDARQQSLEDLCQNQQMIEQMLKEMTLSVAGKN